MTVDLNEMVRIFTPTGTLAVTLLGRKDIGKVVIECHHFHTTGYLPTPD